MSYKVLGHIIAEETDDPLSDLLILAILADDTEKILGEIKTNSEGYFELEYTLDVFKEFYSYEEPDLYLESYNQKGTWIHTTEQQLNPQETTHFDTRLSAALLDWESETFDFDADAFE